ncbi:sulfatase [Fimbriiglobus ruber]|nr:sulfatase [Fimbriiglobus ruber]
MMRPMLAAVILVGVFTSAAPAAEPARPNVLFVIADDWGYGHAGAYGCKWVNTPAFDRVAKEGVLFNHCFTSNPKCSPCRASILTGRNSWQTEEACCHFGIFRAKWAVYPDLLESAGYHVGFTGKGWGPGDFKTGGFKRNPAGPAYSKYTTKVPTKGIAATDYARNFEDFLAARKPGQPFCFWYGGHEPHRDYEEGSGVRAGKKLADVDLPAYYPNSPVIRSDYLDYAVEVEWFDSHLGKILKQLEAANELDNTLIVVTSDHGAPFPRIKGQIYESGYHIPLAIRWGAQVKGGRTVDDFINVRDFSPTFLVAAGVPVPATVTGKSFVDVLKAEKSGWVDATRNRMLIGKERHDLGRPDDLGYPARAIRTPEYLYVRNFEPDRWPVGNPETGYRNCDDGPSKTHILTSFDRFYKLCFGKRPAEELYRVDKDGDCVTNLAEDSSLREVKEALRKEMEELLRKDEDPRILGNGKVFDTYQYVGPRKHAYDTWLKNQ